MPVETLALVRALAGAFGSLDACASFLASLVGSLDVGVLVEDGDRRVLLANDEFCRIVGYEGDAAALVGTERAAVAAAIAPLLVDAEACERRMAEVHAAGEPVRGDRVLFADGRIFERDFAPLVGDGRRFGGLWTYGDVTRSVRGEEELAWHAAALGALADAAALSEGERVHALLGVCTAALDLPVAVISRVAGDEYVVVAAVAPDGSGVHAGRHLQWSQCSCLEDAICDGVASRSSRGLRECHPLGALVPLEAWIAARVRHEAGGTTLLELAGPTARGRPFGGRERDLVELAARLVHATSPV